MLNSYHIKYNFYLPDNLNEHMQITPFSQI